MSTREQPVTEAFVALGDTLGRKVDPLVLLGRLIRHSVALTSIEAAGVMLANARGSLRSAITTEYGAELTEIWQSEVKQGPCIEGFTTGTAVHAPELAAQQDRWPDFVPLARAAGYEGAHALPLQQNGQTIGALNLLARTPVALTYTESTLLRGFADVVTTAVLAWDRQLLGPDDVTARTQAALSGKAVFDIASGMLAATADITPAEAAVRLHAYADHHQQRPTDIADQLVRRTLDPHTVLTPQT
ncbi:GAF and ANTAR domain-containing protein [Streptomyces sp. NPDC091268]|uniref:GAF and ANTAR domain-containing protein n=1 Tax=Streptomyces sp. NPDC091268 TaxID=3365979 RepID=UPI0038258CB9